MSDLYIQRSNYYLSLSEQRIIIKNDNKEIVKRSIHFTRDMCYFW